MKVIISTELQDNYTNFVVVKDFKSVNPEGVDVLIIHKFDESELNVGIAISDLNSRGISHFLYICENPIMSIKMSVMGVHGSVYEDEFYFDDEDELMALLEEIGVSDEANSLALTSTQIVKDFIGAFSRREEKIQSPIYLEQVTQAVNELGKLTHFQELQISEMSMTANKVFDQASSVINSLQENKKEIEKKLDELEEKQASGQGMRRSSFSSSIMFFPSYKYTGVTTKVLCVREYSPCRYLTSFLLAYVHYLHYDKNRRVKLVITHQKGIGVSARYAGFTTITQESSGKDELYANEIIATNNPKKDVMQKLTSQSDDIVVVLDRLYGNQPIVTGKVTNVSAVSGASDIDRFKLKAENCIFTITEQPTELFHIPLIRNYAKETDMRYAAYSQVCKEQFKVLDGLIGVQ